MLAVAAGCSGSPDPITVCEPSAGLVPDCRFQNPEDLALAPAGGRLIVSQMGSMDGSRPGNLVLYRPGGRIETLFPGETIADDRAWGSPDCPPPGLAAFAPHGLHLSRRQDGAWQLLVVNHGGQESVEFFEVADDGTDLVLTWRGCAEGPDQAAFNDVVGTTEGGFYVTQMFPADGQLLAMLKGLVFGSETGFVYHWTKAGGFARVPGSGGAFPNGIEMSPDEDWLFVNLYLSRAVLKLNPNTGEGMRVPLVGRPDNSAWAEDGRLLVANHTAGITDLMNCQSLESGTCPIAFRIDALDPATLAVENVIEHAGPPMGAATVAVPLEGSLYLGTFAGDRIARIRWGG